jgi:pimeloyl-ACP methyl ester carboxylesterase
MCVDLVLIHLNSRSTESHHLFQQLSPWYFPVPELAPQVELFILGGDPACGAVVSLREHENFKAKRPDVKTGIVKGATHSVHREDPHAIVKVALSGDISPYAYGATQ